MKIACIMMQKNEKDLLQTWIEYHSDLFGIENLFIFDNGSTDKKTCSLLQKYEKLGLSISYDKSSKDDFEQKGNIISEKIKLLEREKKHDFFFPLDCDELIATIDKNNDVKIDLNSIQNELSKHVSDPRTLKINEAYDNSPLHPDYYLPRKDQRKSFFAYGACDKLDIGFHEGRARHSNESTKTNIVYFHLHHKPYSDFQESCREKLIGRVESFQREALEKYLMQKKPGYHLIPRMLMQKAEYESQFNINGRIFFKNLREKLTLLECKLPIEPKPEEKMQQTPHAIGLIDEIMESENSLTLIGWGITSKNKPIDEFLIKTGDEFKILNYVERKKREDVVRKIQGAPIDCGFIIKISNKEIELNSGIELYEKSHGRHKLFKMGLSAAKNLLKIMSDSKMIIPRQPIPSHPCMEKVGVFLLEEQLKKATIFLEYGAGGSTLFASALGVKTIHSVESDKMFLDAVLKKAASLYPATKIHAHFVDIGKTKEWGHPVNTENAQRWPKYCIAPWQSILDGDQQFPDLILIDGRFRVACFLASLLLAKPETVILFDDYMDRPHYHIVEKYLRPSKTAGRLAQFIIEPNMSYSSVLLDLLVYSTNPA